MKTTRYFVEQVLRKRTYLDVALCRSVMTSPLRRERQDDGRVRFRGEVRLPGETEARILRVVTLEDGETLHNAFIDRGFDKTGVSTRPGLRQGREMKIHYYPETDSLYIELRATAATETREIADGLNADFDADGTVVGFDIDHASAKLDLATLEATSLPFETLRAA